MVKLFCEVCIASLILSGTAHADMWDDMKNAALRGLRSGGLTSGSAASASTPSSNTVEYSTKPPTSASSAPAAGQASGNGPYIDNTGSVIYQPRSRYETRTQADVDAEQETLNQGLIMAIKRGQAGAAMANGNLTTAIERLQYNADRGDYTAQLQLGNIYAKGGNGVPKDCEKAAYWYQKANQNQPTSASTAIGDLNMDGGCGKTDRNVAFNNYFELAQYGNQEALQKSLRTLNQNDPEAVYQMGLLYDGALSKGAVGDSIKDRNAAISWLQKAIRMGHAKACTYLGEIYLDTRTVASYQKARDLFVLGQKRGDAYAGNRLQWTNEQLYIASLSPEAREEYLRHANESLMEGMAERAERNHRANEQAREERNRLMEETQWVPQGGGH